MVPSTSESWATSGEETAMLTVNQPQHANGRLGLTLTLGGLDLQPGRGHEDVLPRVTGLPLGCEEFEVLASGATTLVGSERFHDVITTFAVPADETPAGFRVEASLRAGGVLEIDLVRDISYDKNGAKRPTGVIFSADTANPYELAPIAPLLGNLTCNPGIVYDMFINNPEANVDHKFSTLDEVMTELGTILGPGCDMSVELENPFDPDFDNILAEIEPMEKILSKYRLVVKVPHTGPVNYENYHQLLEGDKRLSTRYTQASTKDALWGHNLALKLREHGYRVNFTLMFEPYQAALALQAKPAFINSFVRHRLKQSEKSAQLIAAYRQSGDVTHLKSLRDFLTTNDHFVQGQEGDLLDVLAYAENMLRYRRFDEHEGSDGLDSLRHNLRLLKHCNLPDTRVIVCSMEGDQNYPDIDTLTADPEFADVIDRLVITAEPGYLARFTSSAHVVSYQRRFMGAAATAVRA